MLNVQKSEVNTSISSGQVAEGENRGHERTDVSRTGNTRSKNTKNEKKLGQNYGRADEGASGGGGKGIKLQGMR